MTLFVGTPEKTFQSTIDESRGDLAQFLETVAQTIHGAGSEVLDENIDLWNQLQEDLPTLSTLDIESQTLLVAAEKGEKAESKSAKPPGGIPLRSFDVDDVGSQIGQHHSTGRTQDGMSKLEDFNALQR